MAAKITITAVIEDNEMDNVELHRAESMVNDDIIIEKINDTVKPDPMKSVYMYIGNHVRSLRAVLLQVTAELIMFIYMFSYVLRSTTSTVMIMDKVCLVHLEQTEHICQNLHEFPTINIQVEKMTNNYHLGHTLIQTIPSAILALFIGSWSDKYGRKPPIIAALIGIILDGFGTIACAYFSHSRVEYYFIPAMFTGFSGGFIGVLMVLYSYASDISTSGKRTMKYAFVEAAMGISMPLGLLVGGWLFKYSDAVHVFALSTSGHILGLFCVVLLLEETRGLDNYDSLWKKFTSFWTVNSVVGSFKATIKKRPNHGRRQIWLLILGMSIAVLTYASLAGIMFIYVHHQFNWDNATYSTVNAVYPVIGLILMLVIVPLSKKLNIGDTILGIAGSVSLGLKLVGTGLAFEAWIFHLAQLLGLLSSLGTLAARSLISKIVSKDDLGKVFSFMTTAECFIPILTTALVSQVFNATLKFFPGLIFVIVGALLIIPTVVFTWIHRLPTMNYEEMEEKEKKESEKNKPVHEKT